MLRLLTRSSWILAFAVLLWAGPSEAFSLLTSTSGVRNSLEWAPRWSATPGEVGLADGIRVAVDSAFFGSTGFSDLSIEGAVSDRIVAAFEAWENDGLSFDITFDGPAVEGIGLGAEIDIFTAPTGDPRLCNALGGCTWWNYVWSNDRLLTNGQVVPGYALIGIDIYMSSSTYNSIFSVFTPFETALDIFQRTMSHEIGHAIGIHHADETSTPNYDTDFDPENTMIVDPFDPAAGFALSPFVDCTAIMTSGNGLCDVTS